MDCFITCNRSASEIGALDCKELLNKNSEVFTGLCLTKNVSTKDLAKLSYRAQSAHRVCIYLSNFEIQKNWSEKELAQASLKAFEKIDFSLFSSSKSFGVFCEHNNSFQNLDSTMISRSIGGVFDDLFKEKKLSIDVNLTKPDTHIFVYCTDDKCFLGVDLISFDLSKRPYKLITQASSLNGVFAYTIARLTGVSKNSVFLDPFCGSGTIVIEMGLFQQEKSCFHFERKFSGLRFPLTKESFEFEEQKSKEQEINKSIVATGFDNKLKVITSAKKNSKIAGVNNGVHFSKVDIEWIDSKFDEGEVDVIVTNPPKENVKGINNKEIKELYDELFNQGRFVLKDNGKLGILTNKTNTLLELAKRNGYSHIKTMELFSGGQQYFLMIFSPPERITS